MTDVSAALAAPARRAILDARMWRHWVLGLLCLVAFPGCARHIAAPVTDPLLAPPPHSVKLLSSSRDGRGPGGIGGFETSAYAFIVYASRDPRDILIAWYQNRAAPSYRYGIQNRGDSIDITAFSKRDTMRHADVTLSSDLPADAIRAYRSATTNATALATAPADTRTYVTVVIGRG